MQFVPPNIMADMITAINEKNATNTGDSVNTDLKYAEGQVMTRLPMKRNRKRPANPRRSKYELLLLEHRGQWVCLRANVSAGLIHKGNAKWVKRNHAEIVSRKIDGITYIFGRIPK